jgi:hypothetical protein
MLDSSRLRAVVRGLSPGTCVASGRPMRRTPLSLGLAVALALALVPSAAFAQAPPRTAKNIAASPAAPSPRAPKAIAPARAAAKATAQKGAHAKAIAATAKPAPPPPTQAEMTDAVAWAARLAPSVGFAYSVDGYHALPESAKAVLNVFGRARNYVRRVAGSHGVGAVVTEHLTEIEVGDVDAELGVALAAVKPARGRDAYTAEDASDILRAAAKRPGVDQTTKDALLRSADTWDAKKGDASWKTARRMKPKPEEPADPAAAGPSRYEQQLKQRAQDEWDRGRRAIGWGPEWKEFDIRRDTFPDGKSGDIRAFTYDRWMQHRVEVLREEDEQRAYTRWLHDPFAM